MNRELFDKVKARVLAEPLLVDMSVITRATVCGTVGCIAGHALLVGREAFDDAWDLQWERAKELLELADHEAELLFQFHDEIYTDDEDYDCRPYTCLTRALDLEPKGTPAYAAVVARAIDLCMQRYDEGKWQ